MKWSNALKGKFLIFVFSDTYGPASLLQNGRLCLQAQLFSARHHSISKISVLKKIFLILYPSLETLQLVGSEFFWMEDRSNL